MDTIMALINDVNRQAYFMQYGRYMTPREAVQSDLLAADYKRNNPGQTIFQARRYAVNMLDNAESDSDHCHIKPITGIKYHYRPMCLLQ